MTRLTMTELMAMHKGPLPLPPTDNVYRFMRRMKGWRHNRLTLLRNDTLPESTARKMALRLAAHWERGGV